MTGEPRSAGKVIALMIAELEGLDSSDRDRVLAAVAAYFGSSHSPTQRPRPAAAASEISSSTRHEVGGFSDDRSPSPKAFLREKQPSTDVEKVACLGYYLAHYRGTPFFKTGDLSQLNTEAAQPAFSNTSYAAANALKAGYLVPGEKGTRQLSAIGERYVEALPDKNAARDALSNAGRPRRSKRRARGTEE